LRLHRNLQNDNKRSGKNSGPVHELNPANEAYP
jgi:hypothetical protein